MEESFAVKIINDPQTSNESSTFNKQDEPVRLLYSKSKVYVHPSNNVNDFIPGYMSIIEKSPKNYLIAWTPEALIPSKDMDAFVRVDVDPDNTEQVEASIMVASESEEHMLYAVSAPIDTIHSLLIKPPSFSKWYGNVIINFKDGHNAGPFWFHDDESKSTMLQKNTQGGKFTANCDDQVRWGGDEFLERLCHFINITKSNDIENLYELMDNKPIFNINNKQQPTLFEATQMDPLIATLKEAKWSILEKLSRVTKFSRDTAVNILNSPASKPFVPLLPPSVQDLCNNETVKRTIDDYDSARIFLAKWAAGLAAQSENYAPRERKYRNVGVWGHDDWEEDTALGVFEILNSENDFSIPTHTRTDPITEAEWSFFFDLDGKLVADEAIVRKRIFSSGIEAGARRDAWLFLTGVYPWNSTAVERHLIEIDRRESYHSLKNRWFEDKSHRESDTFRDQKHRIDKDVHRTDRTVDIYANENMPNPDPLMTVGTNENLEILKNILCTYNIFNTELGYVQGMSDLLSPLYAIIGEEELAFWAFVGFMERLKSNFYTDQSGMHKQLLTLDLLLQFMDPQLYKHFVHTDSSNFFFCFRWLLVWFKREFPWKDMLTLWEVLWTDYLTDKFHLFIALSILDQHRTFIIDYLKNFDEILKYINDLSMSINLEETLQRAEILYYQFKQRVEAVDNKREQLIKLLSHKANLTEIQREDAKDDLNRLPVIHQLLREILESSFADAIELNEKQ